MCVGVGVGVWVMGTRSSKVFSLFFFFVDSLTFGVSAAEELEQSESRFERRERARANAAARLRAECQPSRVCVGPPSVSCEPPDSHVPCGGAVCGEAQRVADSGVTWDCLSPLLL